MRHPEFWSNRLKLNFPSDQQPLRPRADGDSTLHRPAVIVRLDYCPKTCPRTIWCSQENLQLRVAARSARWAWV